MALTDLTGTKWRFNSVLSMSYVNVNYEWFISFTSSTANFSSLLYRNKAEQTNGIAYGSTSNFVYIADTDEWTDESNRLIEITGGADATNTTLIQWIQSNATQIIDQPVLPSFADVEVTPHEGYITMTINGVDFNLKTAASVSLISFSINHGISDVTYQAEDGMTWTEWCASEYNTSDLYIDAGGYVTSGGLFVSGPSGYVNASDEIISMYHYAMVGGGAD